MISRASTDFSAGSPESRARDAAEQIVSITFVQPMLAQLRKTSNAAPPFAPSAAEGQFQSLLDGITAQGIVRASRFPLIDRLASDLLRNASQKEGESAFDSPGSAAAAEPPSDPGASKPTTRTP